MFLRIAIATLLLALVGGCSHPQATSLQERAHAFGELLDSQGQCLSLKDQADNGRITDESGLRSLYEASKKTGCLNRHA